MPTQNAQLRTEKDDIDWPSVVADYKARVPVDEICSKHTISRQGMYGGLDRYEIPRRGHPRGPEHKNWLGGVRRNKRTGYVREWVDPSDPMAVMVPPSEKGSHVLQHRLVMARFIERPLRSDEEVHHKNNVKHDNRLENLQLRTLNHGNGASLCCADCGSINLIPKDL